MLGARREKSDAQTDESLIKQAKWMLSNQGCVTRNLAAKILKIFLEDDDRYLQYQVQFKNQKTINWRLIILGFEDIFTKLDFGQLYY